MFWNTRNNSWINKIFKRRSTGRFRKMVILIALAVILLAVMAITQQPRDIVLVRTEGIKAVRLPDVLSRNYNPRGSRSDVALDIPTLAALAANVYEPADIYDASCSPTTPGRIPIKGWEQTKGWSYPKACNAALSGLYYEVWHSMDSEGYRLVAVVFRGTVPQILAHWCSNLRTASTRVCDPSSDQYLSIVPLIDEVLSGDYDQWGPDRNVVAVGHSLGGGLAELAGRASFIQQVFAFDSSPVTGRELAEAIHKGEGDEARVEQVMNAYLQKANCEFRNTSGREGGNRSVYRVYEHGEVLAALRMVKRWSGSLPEGSSAGVEQVVEYRTNLLDGNPVSQHSMKALACALRAESSRAAEQAATPEGDRQ